MSNCAHKQSTYKLTPMPKCPRCKIELVKVMVIYDNIPTLKWEWECCKCGKHQPVEKTPEPEWSQQDIWLANWCKNEESRNNKRSSKLSRSK